MKYVLTLPIVIASFFIVHAAAADGTGGEEAMHPALKKLDENGDQRISFEEYAGKRLVVLRQKLEEDKLRLQNEESSLDAKEKEERKGNLYFEERELKEQERFFKKRFQRMDMNGDGEISPKELNALQPQR